MANPAINLELNPFVAVYLRYEIYLRYEMGKWKGERKREKGAREKCEKTPKIKGIFVT